MVNELKIRKLNAITLKMQNATVDERIALKKAFCDEMVSLLIDEIKSDSVIGKTLSDVYLSDIKDGNYIKAVDCFEYVESINI
jgi:hypothetical protein